MANKNEEKHFYQLGFYLGGGCEIEFSEINDIRLRSRNIEQLAIKLKKYIKNFRKNVFNADIYEQKGKEITSLLFNADFEELKNWFKERGIKL